MNVTSLSQIPLVLFSEFSLPNTEPASESFSQTGGRTIVTITPSKVSGPNGPHTLVLADYICAYHRMHQKRLMVFNYPVKTEAFAPGESPVLSPKLSIRFSADDPPYTPQFSSGRRFEPKKGFWVPEHLTVGYGDFPNAEVSVISHYEDWEFAFLLQMQQRCHELARQVVSRGHWQCEWNPKGDYSEEPVLH